MPKVLHVIPSLDKGGAEKLTIDTCNELNKRDGWEAKIIILHDVNNYVFLLDGTEVIYCPSTYIPSITGKPTVDIEKLATLIEKEDPDIIHTHLFEAEIVTREAGKKGIKYYTHLHNNMPQFEKLSILGLNKARLTNYFERQQLLKKYRELGNRFIAISNNVAEYFKQNMPQDMHRIEVIHNAVDVARFALNGEKKPDNETVRMVTVGRLDANKNHEFLLNVMYYLKSEGHKVHLDIIGNGVLMNELSQLKTDLDLDAEVFIHGHVERVEEYLHKADIYVHSSITEGFGLVFVEAMAAGLPLVSTDGGGNRDVVKDGENGFMLFDENIEDFADKILQLHNDRQLYARFSKNGQTIAAKFDMKKYVDKLIPYYNEIIS